jgi:CubicO group peptidase (beta-lactamase class C family)
MKSYFNRMGIISRASKIAARYMNGLLVLCLLFAGSVTIDSAPSRSPDRPSVSPPHELKDLDELKTFTDTFFKEQMQQQHIPGAVFVLVKDGSIILARGYGYADIKQQTPVIPERTVFRVDSISKLFTTTAVMQLAERNQVLLDEDVNSYLTRFKVPDTYPGQPVTLANLLTHTAGFADGQFGRDIPSTTNMIPLEDYLATRLPPRVFPPGQIFNYSPYGMGLAGYIVEVVSGLPFARYIDENILQPLDMGRSSFQPLSSLKPDLATNYRFHNNTWVSDPSAFYLTNLPPAGSLHTTAIDMAHFMMAQLQMGQYEGKRILEPATAQEMQSQHFRQHPQLPGMAYGFFESLENGHRVLRHAGDGLWSSSFLFLVPDENLGVFIAFNTSVPFQDDPRIMFMRQFFDHYYPQSIQSTPSPHIDSTQGAPYVAGIYRWTRYDHRTAGKFFPFPPNAFQQGTLVANPDSSLTLHFPFDVIKPSRWVQVGPLLFQRDSGTAEYLAFREDQPGHIAFAFTNTIAALPPLALEKVAWYDTVKFQLALMATLFLVFSSIVVVWPIRYLRIRRHSGETWNNKFGQKEIVLALIISLLNVLFFIGVVWSTTWDATVFAFQLPITLRLLLILPTTSAALTIPLAIIAVLVLHRSYWSASVRVHYALVTLAAVIMVWFTAYWNLFVWFT